MLTGPNWAVSCSSQTLISFTSLPPLRLVGCFSSFVFSSPSCTLRCPWCFFSSLIFSKTVPSLANIGWEDGCNLPGTRKPTWPTFYPSLHLPPTPDIKIFPPTSFFHFHLPKLSTEPLTELIMSYWISYPHPSNGLLPFYLPSSLMHMLKNVY